MSLARLRAGEITTGISAVLLTVLLALKWARPETSVIRSPGSQLQGRSDTAADQVVNGFVHRLAESGYHTLGWLVVAVLLMLILLAVTLVVLTVVERETPVLAVVTAVITVTWSVVTFLVLFVRLVLYQPDLGLALTSDRVNLLLPSTLGLLCVVGIGAGAWLTLRDDRLTSPRSAPPPVPVRQAPPVSA